MSVALALESFSRPAPALVVQMPDVDDYERGLAEGRALAEAECAADLIGALTATSQELASQNLTLETARAEVMASIAPVIHELARLLLPVGLREKIGHLVGVELQRLVTDAPLKRCKIRCPEEYRDLIESCVATLAQSRVDLVADPSATAVEITCEGGRIVYDPDMVTANLSALISQSFELDRL